MAKLIINAGRKKAKINKDIYGHFAEHLGRGIYEGIYVGEDSEIPNVRGIRQDAVEALKDIKVPVLRWPGGCFADEYHWKDGIGPKENRKKIINTHWGGSVEDNSFGTHEFMELCEQLGCDAYINGNLGSGSPQEMAEWVEYLTFDGISPMAELRAKNGRKEPWKVKYFGIGNENWGCGGNMLPEYYGNEYRRFQTFVKNYSNKNIINKICCGPNVDDYEWTEKVLEVCHRRTQKDQHGFMDGFSLHYYTLPHGWVLKGSATDFDEKTYYTTLAKTLYMETLIKNHSAIMDTYDPYRKIGLMIDEWGTWYNVEPGTNPGFLYQQNTMRDAIIAGVNLNLFNKNCDRVKMANIAQMINVLQAVILTDKDKMIKTPTYYVFKLYREHQESTLLDSYLETKTIGLEEKYQVPNMTESVSIDNEGTIHITITNLSLEESYPIEGSIAGKAITSATGELLTGAMRDKNTFENMDNVKLKTLANIEIHGEEVKFTIPPCSVVYVAIK